MSSKLLLCPCMFIVPTSDNDGRPIKAEVRLRIQTAITRQFEAFTMLPTGSGLWRNQREPNNCYLVAVPSSRVQELKMLVAKIGKELGQKQMYFEARPPSVDLIDIDDTTPPLT